MTEYERTALEAKRLASDETLTKALADMRRDAIEELVQADASDYEDVLFWQSRIGAIDEFKLQLQRYVLAVPAKD